jgi:UDP-3-O-[3-hydroxymyristoyl] N-acetylglucosamine deacetylase
MNQALVKKVLADPECHRIVRVSGEAEATAARIAAPSMAGLEGQAA